MQTEGSHWPEMNEERRPIGLWLVSGCDVVGCCHGAEKSRQRVCTNRSEAGSVTVIRLCVCVLKELRSR